MKIAIYGVSRSGKDYFIKELIKYLTLKSDIKAYHLEGSKTLNCISLEKHKCSFNSLSDVKKKNLRSVFLDVVNEKEKKHQLILVDGHYSFIKAGSYDVIFTNKDKITYDHFFYLDTPSNMILQFARNSKCGKRNLKITKKEISNWKEFEKRKLTKICSSLNKELVILDEDIQFCVKFVHSWVESFDIRYCYDKTAIRILDKLTNKFKSINKVLILDCDKTVSTNDVTFNFCEKIDVDSDVLKKIFHNDRYTSYQFYKASCLYKSKSQSVIKMASSISLGKVNLNNDILKLIKNKRNFLVIGLTSGIYEIWDLISKTHHLFHILIGNTCSTEPDYYVTPLLKKAIVLELKRRMKEVTAIGDSIIDIPMLEAAHFGYIVAHEKLNKAVEKHIETEGQTKIKQIFKNEFSYNLSNVTKLEAT